MSEQREGEAGEVDSFNESHFEQIAEKIWPPQGFITERKVWVMGARTAWQKASSEHAHELSKRDAEIVRLEKARDENFRQWKNAALERDVFRRQMVASANTTLAALEIPGTANDLYDPEDRCGNAVLKARSSLDLAISAGKQDRNEGSRT